MGHAPRSRALGFWPLWAGYCVFACGIVERHVEERAAGGSSASPIASAPSGAGGSAPAAGGTAFSTGGVSIGPPNPSGGMQVGGKPPFMGSGGVGIVPGCMVPAVTPTCTQAGAPVAVPGWCEDAAGGANEYGASVDTFEDHDDISDFVLNGRGGWFVANDGSGQQFPSPCVTPSLVPGGRGTSGTAMHTYGSGFAMLPTGFAMLGVALHSGAPDCTGPVDATGYDGVEFWVRGSGFVRFVVATLATTPTSNFGECQAGCYDSHGALVPLTQDWSQVRVPFVKLAQEGWGTMAAFERSKILTLQWSPKTLGGPPPSNTAPANCFDFWIDDVAFYADAK